MTSAEDGNEKVKSAISIAKVGVSAVQSAVKRAHQAFGGEYGEVFECTVRGEDGKIHVPDPVIDEREFNEIDELAKRYEKATSSGKIAQMGKKIATAAPEPIKELADKAGAIVKDTLNGFTEQELMAAAIKKAAEGFGEFEKQAAKASVSKEYVISRINEGTQGQKVSALNEISLLRSYDVAATASKEKARHMGIALVEGGGTGAAGFWGLPANLALSMLIYFRAVQSVAMFYGYDVKEDPEELIIASEVFSKAMSPTAASDTANDYVGKILVYTEMASIKKAATKQWAAMIDKGGAALLLAQMRALANGAAKKALEKSGKKGLEAGVFTKVLAQVGEKLTLKNIARLVPLVGAGFGAFFDTAQMSRIVEISGLFYHKRFILEKEERIQRLLQEDEAQASTENNNNQIASKTRDDANGAIGPRT